MTDTTKHPKFQTNEDGLIRVSEGEFEGTIYKYKDIGIDEKGTLKYNSELQCMVMDGEDITLTHTHRNEAKFLNTIATPILTTMIEGLHQLEQAAKANEGIPEPSVAQAPSKKPE